MSGKPGGGNKSLRENSVSRFPQRNTLPLSKIGGKRQQGEKKLQRFGQNFMSHEHSFISGYSF